MIIRPIRSKTAFPLLKNKHEVRSRICIPDASGLHILKIRDIKRMQARDNYTRIIFNNNKELLVSKTLKELEAMTGKLGFIRVHKSHLVRIDLITFIGTSFIKIEGEEKLPLARRRKCMLQLLLSNSI